MKNIFEIALKKLEGCETTIIYGLVLYAYAIVIIVYCVLFDCRNSKSKEDEVQ